MNEERILERLEELEQFLQNFPNSDLVPAIKSEIEYLKSLL